MVFYNVTDLESWVRGRQPRQPSADFVRYRDMQKQSEFGTTSQAPERTIFRFGVNFLSNEPEHETRREKDTSNVREFALI
jgi:hypothetical protein